MATKRLNRYELYSATSSDILEAEKADVDEVETDQMKKRELGRTVDYKKKHQEFFKRVKYSDKDFDVNAVKKVQMQVYASNSSDVYNLTSKASIILTIVSVIFAILMFAVALTVIVFNTMSYSLYKYEEEDMTGIVEKGDILVVSKSVFDIFVDDVVVYRTLDGVDVVRIVRDYDTENIILNNANNTDQVVVSIADIDERITGYVKSKMNGFGEFLLFMLKYWYYFAGGLFILMVACFVAKLLIDRHYNILLIRKLEIERENMEKRRKYLAESIDLLEKKKGTLFNNVEAFGDMLDVNKAPDTRRERKMKKLQMQLRDRQQKQIESLKGEKQEEVVDEEKKQEKQVVDFLREKINEQEKENKEKLTEEEIERRRKEAEETNKNVGH